jgi:tetratricopeptide (TPR) repeat protein
MIALQDWSSAGWHAFDIYKTYLYQDVSDLMMVWAEKCIYAWERGNDKRGKAMSVMIRATMTDKDDEFIRLAQSALAIWGRETFREQLEAIAILGMLAAERKEYVDAERFFYQAVELANKYNDIDFKGTAYEYLGEIALERGNWVEARKQFEQAFVLAKELGRIELKADAQYGLARVHEAEQNLDLALPLAQDALKIFERLRLVDVVKVRELVEMLEKKMSVE